MKSLLLSQYNKKKTAPSNEDILIMGFKAKSLYMAFLSEFVKMQ